MQENMYNGQYLQQLTNSKKKILLQKNQSIQIKTIFFSDSEIKTNKSDN